MLSFVLSFVFLMNPPGEIKDSKSLIKVMHERYSGKFNKNITFIQIDTEINPDGSRGKVTSSYEAFHFPGKFRADHGPTHSQEGIIVSNDTVYDFEGGQIVGKVPGIYDVLTLYGDIYFYALDEAMVKIHKLGYDMTKFRSDTWKGKDVFVIGADKGDVTSPQFWIEKEELYLVRNINISKESGKLEDNQYLEHQKVENAWVESKVDIYSGGKLIRQEKIAEAKANKQLDMKIFDVKHLGNVHWHDFKKN